MKVEFLPTMHSLGSSPAPSYEYSGYDGTHGSLSTWEETGRCMTAHMVVPACGRRWEDIRRHTR